MKWREVPVSMTANFQARAWWRAEYDRHIETGFSDVDARAMVAHLASNSVRHHTSARQTISNEMERR